MTESGEASGLLALLTPDESDVFSTWLGDRLGAELAEVARAARRVGGSFGRALLTRSRDGR